MYDDVVLLQVIMTCSAIDLDNRLSNVDIVVVLFT